MMGMENFKDIRSDRGTVQCRAFAVGARGESSSLEVEFSE